MKYEASENLIEAISLYEDELFEQCIPIFQVCLDNGEAEAASFLGNIFEDSQSGYTNKEKAKEYYLIGAKLGSLRSMYHAGVLYGDKGDLKSAIQLLTEAADNGFVLAQAILGFLYREGPHNLRSRKKAAEYMRLAAGNEHLLALGAYSNIRRHRDGISGLFYTVYAFCKAPLILLSENDDRTDTSPKLIVQEWTHRSPR